ncbi:MAG: glycosyltransferase [Candidatus Scalindua sp.]
MTTPFLHPYKFLQWITGRGNKKQEKENLIICRPFIVLHDHISAKIKLVNRINRLLLKAQIRRWNKEFNLKNESIVSWIYDPFQDEYLNLIGEQIKIIEYYDEYFAWAEVPFFRTHKDLSRKEKKVLSEVDIVFVVSNEILANKSDFHSNIHVVPNATDFCHFNKAANENFSSSDDMGLIKKPLIGYIGDITQRIDFNLLDYLAQNNTDWSIVLIGGGTGIPLILKSRQNVHFLGAKPYEALPAYMKAFDVCIIPYNPNDPFNVHCSPLKLYDYLATGKPIVSTDLPAVREFEDLVRIAQDTEEFELQVKEALNEQSEDLREKRLRKGRENSWEYRARKMLSIIEATLEEQHA